jgi:selT/selW/selH-like putative selenoprotein
MAEALFTALRPEVGPSHPVRELVLIPSDRGRFEVTVDGELIYSKAATGQHTTNEYIIQQVRDRMR